MGTTDLGNLFYFYFCKLKLREELTPWQIVSSGSEVDAVKSIISFGWGNCKVVTVTRKTILSHLKVIGSTAPITGHLSWPT